MPIHHAITKRAATQGVILTSDDAQAVAFHAERGLRIERDIEDEDGLNDLAKDLLVDVTGVLAFNDDEANKPWTIRFADGDFVAYNGDEEAARDPELADLIETIQEERASAEPEEDEDEERGSVVPEVFKRRYAEAGHPTHCGDWLAETLNGLCRVLVAGTKKETTDLDRLEAIAVANGVEVARVDQLGTATNGWQGRYRMTVRNMLTKVVAAKGFLFVPEGCGKDADTEIAAPKSWCATHSPKAKPAPKADVKKPGAPSGKKSAKSKAKAAK